MTQAKAERIAMTAKDFEKTAGTKVYWLGGGGAMINSRGTVILIDPLLKGFDMKILTEAPLLPEDVPHADAVIITHCDNDHFSKVTLSEIKDRIDSYILQIRNSILHKCDKDLHLIDHLETRMALKLDLKLNEARLSYKRFTTLLEAYNAQNVLKRGYSLVLQDDRVIKSKKELKHKEFDIRFADGIVKAKERD